MPDIQLLGHHLPKILQDLTLTQPMFRCLYLPSNSVDILTCFTQPLSSCHQVARTEVEHNIPPCHSPPDQPVLWREPLLNLHTPAPNTSPVPFFTNMYPLPTLRP